MHIRADSIDDLLRDVFEKILTDGERVVPSQGPNKELFGVVLELTNPLARVSRTEMKGRLYSALGELMWYLAGSDELAFIEYYLGKDRYKSDDGETVWGAYGPRLFGKRDGLSQFERVTARLAGGNPSRKAVIQLFDSKDISENHADVPCTCVLQFLARESGLDLFVCMRSNDAYKGLPHDVFAFTMLQEILARDLNLRVGRYKHAAGSLHLYDADEENVREFLGEAWQDLVEMPGIPEGPPWKDISVLTQLEARIRSGDHIDVETQDLSPYWADLARLLYVFALTKIKAATENRDIVDALANQMSSDFFRPYISDRKRRLD